MFQLTDISLLEYLNGSSSSFMDMFMLILTSGYTWIALYIALLYLVVSNSETMSNIMIIVGCALLCVLLSGALNDYIVKPIIGRPRPINDMSLGMTIITAMKSCPKDYSFFSSHAANTMSIAVFFSLLVRERRLFIALITWSLINCYTRLYLGLHYPSDILVGIIWGIIIGYVVYLFYLRIKTKTNENNGPFISTQYTSNGYSIASIDIVMTVLILIYIYSIFRALILA